MDWAKDYRGLHLRITVPVALTAFRRELACVSPRPLDGLELARSAQPSKLTLGGGLEVSLILLCGLGNPLPAEVVHIPVLIVIGSVASFRGVGPDVVLLRNSARPRLAKIRVRTYRLPYSSILLKRMIRLVRNIYSGL